MPNPDVRHRARWDHRREPQPVRALPDWLPQRVAEQILKDEIHNLVGAQHLVELVIDRIVRRGQRAGRLVTVNQQWRFAGGNPVRLTRNRLESARQHAVLHPRATLLHARRQSDLELEPLPHITAVRNRDRLLVVLMTRPEVRGLRRKRLHQNAFRVPRPDGEGLHVPHHCVVLRVLRVFLLRRLRWPGLHHRYPPPAAVPRVRAEPAGDSDRPGCEPPARHHVKLVSGQWAGLAADHRPEVDDAFQDVRAFVRGAHLVGRLGEQVLEIHVHRTLHLLAELHALQASPRPRQVPPGAVRAEVHPLRCVAVQLRRQRLPPGEHRGSVRLLPTARHHGRDLRPAGGHWRTAWRARATWNPCAEFSASPVFPPY